MSDYTKTFSFRLKKWGLPLFAGFGLPLLIFVGLYISTWGTYSVPTALPEAKDASVIATPEFKLHGEMSGPADAPLLIVVHDGPGSDYRTLLPLKELTDRYRILFYDQMGSGLSPRVASSELSIEKSLARLDSLVKVYAQNKPVTLIGHGWGGMLATSYAGSHPKQVERLALLEPGFLNDKMASQVLPAMSKSSLGFIVGTVTRWVTSLHVSGPDRDAREDFVFAQVRHQPQFYCNNKIPERWADYNWRTGFRAWKTITQSTLDEKGALHLDFTKDLDQFKAPVLLVASSCNQVTGRSFQSRQKRLFQNAEVVTVINTGHEMLMDNPKGTLKVLRKYLDAHYFSESVESEAVVSTEDLG